MNISKANYPRYADARAPKSALVRDCLRAFVCGGIICAIGEGLSKLYVYAGLERDMAGLLCSVTLVFAAVLLTGLGVFDRIARFAGSAKAVVSPAGDSYPEGLVLGIGAKIFTVAGPVLLYGTLAGAVYGIIYYIVGLF